jgi:hypothetical protein
MIIYNWAGQAKAEFKTALAPAAIKELMAIISSATAWRCSSGIATTSGGERAASSAR